MITHFNKLWVAILMKYDEGDYVWCVSFLDIKINEVSTVKWKQDWWWEELFCT